MRQKTSAATGSDTQTVTVSDNAGALIVETSGYKDKGVHIVDLTWTGVSSTNVDIYRYNEQIATSSPNNGAYTAITGNKGGGSYTYRVCEAGSTTACSNPVTVTF